MPTRITTPIFGNFISEFGFEECSQCYFRFSCVFRAYCSFTVDRDGDKLYDAEAKWDTRFFGYSKFTKPICLYKGKEMFGTEDSSSVALLFRDRIIKIAGG